MKPLLTEPVAAAEAICRVLEEAGVDLILGLPGGDIMALFDSLYDHRSRLRTMLVRDESQAAIMAEAYGRITGKPAAVVAQGAWLLAKGGMGALEALTGASPVLFLTDLSDKTPLSHICPTQTGTGHYGTWNARRSFAGFMKEVMEAQSPAQAVHLTQLAVKHATAGCPGPVAVIYYGAALRGKVDPAGALPLFETRGYLRSVSICPPADEIEVVRRQLHAARRLTIVAGNGVRVSQGAAALLALAEALDAPIVTTSGGKGVIAETHRLAGGVIGDFGLDGANRLLGEADTILAVGTRLAPGDTVRHHRDLIDPTRQKIIQIDVEPRHVGWSLPIDLGLVGDARLTLEALAGGADHAVGAAGSQGPQRVAAAMADGGFVCAESFSTSRPLLPQRVVQLLNETLPDDVIVTADAGENRIFLNHHYQVKASGGFLQPSSTGAMGYAIASALGAKLAEPGRPIVAVLGDGGFAMSVAAIMSALECDLPIVIVVLNNGILGWVRHVQGNRPIASDLGDFDHAAIARALGCDAVRAHSEDEVVAALTNALESGRMTLIEVMVSGDESWEKVATKLRLEQVSATR